MQYGWIIPARAGFTDHIPCIQVRSGDHPRSRGVYDVYGWVTDRREGSSPLARGLHQDRPLRAEYPRIIPARAGFTRTENFLMGMEDGSSPLARGLPIRIHRTVVSDRIIPARAGFTPVLA